MIMHFDQYNNLNWADWEIGVAGNINGIFHERHQTRRTQDNSV